MKLGFVTAILPELSLAEVAQFASDEGFDCIEVMCWPVGKAERRYAGVTHIDVNNLDPTAVQGVLDDTGVEISSLGYYPNVLSANPEEAEVAIEHLGRVIDGAAALGLDRVNTFIGRDSTQTVDAQWDRMLSVWRPLVARAESKGVHIGIENCPMFFSTDEWPGGKNLATTPRIWRRLFADLASDHLGLNYDPSHLVWQMMDPIRPIKEFAPRFKHVHAKDARVDREALNEVGIMATPLEYHRPKLPGLGDVNWGAFFAELSDAGYTGPVCIEVEDRAYEATLAGRKDALRQSARYLRQFLSKRA